MGNSGDEKRMLCSHHPNDGSTPESRRLEESSSVLLGNNKPTHVSARMLFDAADFIVAHNQQCSKGNNIVDVLRSVDRTLGIR